MTGIDERLAAIDPDYVVYQVKEKFGTLRYYCDPSGEPSPQVREVFEAIVTEAEHDSAQAPTEDALRIVRRNTRLPAHTFTSPLGQRS